MKEENFGLHQTGYPSSISEDGVEYQTIDFIENNKDTQFAGCSWYGYSEYCPETLCKFASDDVDQAFLGERKLVIFNNKPVEFAVIKQYPQ